MKDKILLAQDTITKADFHTIAAWLKTYPRVTKGPVTIEFEKKWASAMGCEYAVFVNSGSSANLLMLYALICDNALKNNKVVIPSLCWITDIAPVIQFGLTPILCDCNLDNLSVDIDGLEQIFIKEEPACFILVPVLGLVPDMDSISQLCTKYDVILLVDNCEGQGSTFNGRSLESYGMMASCSSYFGHILSTIEGGMVTTNDVELYNMCKMLRSHGWDRDIDTQRQNFLREKYNIRKFNSLYTFYQPGFNLRSTDLQAFIGLLQLERLGEICKKRNANYLLYNDAIKNDYWKPKQGENAFVSNLGYPVIHPRRNDIIADLEKNNVEVRPLISGSMGIQPFYIERYGRVEFKNSSIIDQHGFYIPNHPYLKEEDIYFISNIINSYS